MPAAMRPTKLDHSVGAVRYSGGAMIVQINASSMGGTQVRFRNRGSALKGMPEMIRVNPWVMQLCMRNQKSASFVVPGLCSE